MVGRKPRQRRCSRICVAFRTSPESLLVVTVLLTLRDPRDLLRSTWLHHVREGRLQSYPDFLGRISQDRRNGRGPFSIAALGETHGNLFGTGAFTPTVSSEVRKLNATNLGPIRFEMSVNRLLDFYGRRLRRGSTRELRRAITRRISRRLNTGHSRHFSKFVTAEDQLVSDLGHDVAKIRKQFTVL